MATLNSPGVSVSVIDESFYTPAAPGTTPLVVVVSAENKQNSSNTGTASGTLKTEAGKVKLLTSQKDLVDLFGTPVFKTDANNNPIHAGEQNEYGLQAAYSYLGVSNRAYVVRADLDLGQLDASSTAPTGEPDDGTFWFDTASTQYGIFEWNSSPATTTAGQTFTVKYPTVITDSAKVTGGAPKASIGSAGDYAIVATTSVATLFYKNNSGTWVQVGTNAWQASIPAATGGIVDEVDLLLSGDTLVINGAPAVTGVTVIGNTSTGLVKAINDANISGGAVTAGLSSAGQLQLFSTGVDIVVSGTIVAKVGLVPDGNGGYLTSGTFKAPALQISPHYTVPTFKRADNTGSVQGNPTGSIWIKTTTPNLGADWIVKKYSTLTKGWQLLTAPMYSNAAEALAKLDPAGGGINLPSDTLYVKSNDGEIAGGVASFRIYKRLSSANGATTITSEKITQSGSDFFGDNTFEFSVQYTNAGSTDYSAIINVSFITDGTDNADDTDAVMSALTTAFAGTPLLANFDTTTSKISISHKQGGDIKFVDITNSPIDLLFPVASTANLTVDPSPAPSTYVASLWSTGLNGPATGAVSSSTAPSNIPADGRLWYSSLVDEVDILIHNGTKWVGFQHTSSQYYTITDTAGPIVSATAPTKQSDGVTALATGDLWIDTSDLENYPKLSKYNGDTKKWVAVDKADQTTESGILFADARWSTAGAESTAGTIADLLASDYVDTDCPNPALYPKGMLLWNLRRSGFNVKKFVRNHVDTSVGSRNARYGSGEGELMNDYYPHRWVSEAANQENGAGTFGRKAQRKVVVQALQALVNSNQQIRDEESRIFNLLACPGYPELIGELVALNIDRGLTSFVVGDTPARLAADATTLSNWGNNVNVATEDGDNGLVTSDEYLGVFYPWGYTSDNLGNNVVVPPSHMILRTIALNDNISYPWFAPAGTRRGGITNASAVGYVDASTGEFQSVALNTGQRDTLAAIKVNPITYITGTGLVNYGQYTRAKNASALDRINVARLVIYLRRQFSQLAKPYVFEPNDKITRDELKGAAESLLLELVGQRALYDYIVVCDTSNNTPLRIDRNELYLDVAIEPVKAVEFIYIPLRLKNTGEIKALGNQ